MNEVKSCCMEAHRSAPSSRRTWGLEGFWASCGSSDDCRHMLLGWIVFDMPWGFGVGNCGRREGDVCTRVRCIANIPKKVGDPPKKKNAPPPLKIPRKGKFVVCFLVRFLSRNERFSRFFRFAFPYNVVFSASWKCV